MSKKAKISIRISNTFRGSVKDGKFVHELDGNGRWIPSDNLRMVVDDNDIVGSTLPSVFTAKQIETLAKSKPSLKYMPNTAYNFIRTTSLDEVLDGDVVRYPKATAFFYRPKSVDVGLDEDLLIKTSEPNS